MNAEVQKMILLPFSSDLELECCWRDGKLLIAAEPILDWLGADQSFLDENEIGKTWRTMGDELVYHEDDGGGSHCMMSCGILVFMLAQSKKLPLLGRIGNYAMLKSTLVDFVISRICADDPEEVQMLRAECDHWKRIVLRGGVQ